MRWRIVRRFRPKAATLTAFDGLSQFFSTQIPRTYPDGYTFEAWINTTSDKEWSGILATDEVSDRFDDPDGYPFAQMVLSDSGTLRVEISSRAYVKRLDGVTPLNDGQWHHVAFAYSPNRTLLTLYVDGEIEQVEKSADNLGPFPLHNPQVISIGTTRDKTVYFAGSIDDVVVHNRYLEPFEMAQRYRSFLNR